jgi:hypothetical protein
MRHAFFWVAALLLAACANSQAPAGDDCASAPVTEITGSAASSDSKTYRALPFTVNAGTGRIEVSYGWTDHAGPPGTPAAATTFDLGLWDEHGYRDQAGFRGWSGSRQGRLDQDHGPVYIEATRAERGYTPGPIHPGTWYVDLGIASVNTQGADWVVQVRQCPLAAGAAPDDDPVDALHVASAQPGWYHSDFHMHAFHSNPSAPDWDEFVSMARAAKLDFLMVTEYVTGQHWRTLGAVQRANPDLVIWPGREIITYSGHVMSHGETFGYYEYRHGFEDVNIGEIQRQVKAAGALFEINHPTSFPPPAFTSFCRGCYFELGDQVDWDQVDLIEVLNGPMRATGDDVGLPGVPGQIENPFVTTALQLWDQQLAAGHRITAVSGSDSKGVEPDDAERIRRGYGSSATAVWADNLSRPALKSAIQAGHAYIRALGVERSPALEFTADFNGQHAMFGDTLTGVGSTDAVTLHIQVTGGNGQTLRVLRNGVLLTTVPVTSDSFSMDQPALRTPDEGPLGTYYRLETQDAMTRTTIGNPIFLRP